MKLAPSILSADFTRLGEQIAACEAAGADWIHVDVMDGHFVPNLTLGPVIVAAARQATRLPLDVHLMITAPERYLADFARAGADILTVHVEACPHLHRTVQQIKELGKRAGVALNPGTPVGALDEVLADLDLVLVMTVNPGFSGQKFIASMLPKIRAMRARLEAAGSAAELEVDGGFDPATGPLAAAAGATVGVAASAVFKAGRPIPEAIAQLRRALAAGK
ncbi:MAG: ribulose-phosphate 3-epimerase [Anaerolineales bacterium]|nr:ribulose-phosphate 3-epimerase [Anaerolineales bacterium]